MAIAYSLHIFHVQIEERIEKYLGKDWFYVLI